MPHSPAEYVRRPAAPAESPTLGFTHLQFEALLTAARESANPYDFALVTMLGLLGKRGSRQRGVRTQNSLPSGSARTVHGTSPWPTSTSVAPRARSRATSAS